MQSSTTDFDPTSVVLLLLLLKLRTGIAVFVRRHGDCGVPGCWRVLRRRSFQFMLCSIGTTNYSLMRGSPGLAMSRIAKSNISGRVSDCTACITRAGIAVY